MQNKSGDIKRNHKEANTRSIVTKDSNAIIQQTDFFVIVQLRARQTLKTPLARKHARVPYTLSLHDALPIFGAFTRNMK